MKPRKRSTTGLESQWGLATLAATLLLAWLLPLSAQDASGGSESGGGEVLVVQIDTAIHRLSEQVLLEAIEQADATDARAVVVELNTPGGLMNSMRTMTTAILEAETPVIVFRLACRFAGCFSRLLSPDGGGRGSHDARQQHRGRPPRGRSGAGHRRHHGGEDRAGCYRFHPLDCAAQRAQCRTG